VDEARKVIRRLERIQALQEAEASAAELLGEVRQLLAEGEAWLVVERSGARGRSGGGDGGWAVTADEAASALGSCRARLAERRDVVPETARAASI
jgi:hypothetical protein